MSSRKALQFGDEEVDTFFVPIPFFNRQFVVTVEARIPTQRLGLYDEARRGCSLLIADERGHGINSIACLCRFGGSG